MQTSSHSIQRHAFRFRYDKYIVHFVDANDNKYPIFKPQHLVMLNHFAPSSWLIRFHAVDTAPLL